MIYDYNLTFVKVEMGRKSHKEHYVAYKSTGSMFQCDIENANQ